MGVGVPAISLNLRRVGDLGSAAVAGVRSLPFGEVLNQVRQAVEPCPRVALSHKVQRGDTLYTHNLKNLVQAGDQVTSRTRITQIGTTGRSTGPHLHFEVRRNGAAVDPMPLLGGASFQVAKAL
jgi:hypothetical protein